MTKGVAILDLILTNSEEAMSWVGNFRRKGRKHKAITYIRALDKERGTQGRSLRLHHFFPFLQELPKAQLDMNFVFPLSAGPPRWPHISHLFEMFPFPLSFCDIFVQTLIIFFSPKWFWKCRSQSQEHSSALLFPLSCHFSTKFIVPLLRYHISPGFNHSFEFLTSEGSHVYAWYTC